ncbi:unnamed protein product [Cyprideis torosa]|uniref:Uncharacterized protein n=1 Tax=Cyprideis torosa TaxID=163714 RepID=A0A7R8ZWG1_9CRUS|nr:unnamed protein product [Cyprideis torosa]CAG0905186.1 unnamed protein product [Cyprideis torosa]
MTLISSSSVPIVLGSVSKVPARYIFRGLSFPGEDRANGGRDMGLQTVPAELEFSAVVSDGNYTPYTTAGDPSGRHYEAIAVMLTPGSWCRADCDAGELLR